MKIKLKDTWTAKVQLTSEMKNSLGLPSGYSIEVDFMLSTPKMIDELEKVKFDEAVSTKDRLLGIIRIIAKDIHLRTKTGTEPLELVVEDMELVGLDTLDFMPMDLVNAISEAFFSKTEPSK